MVTTILIAPIIEDAPMIWIAKISKSIPGPIWVDKGAYIVQPDAGAPPGIKKEAQSSSAAGGNSQKLKLFIRSNAKSDAPICNGSIQFPKPTKAGMIGAKANTMPCIVVRLLKNSGRM